MVNHSSTSDEFEPSCFEPVLELKNFRLDSARDLFISSSKIENQTKLAEISIHISHFLLFFFNLSHAFSFELVLCWHYFWSLCDIFFLEMKSFEQKNTIYWQLDFSSKIEAPQLGSEPFQLWKFQLQLITTKHWKGPRLLNFSDSKIISEILWFHCKRGREAVVN